MQNLSQKYCKTKELLNFQFGPKYWLPRGEGETIFVQIKKQGLHEKRKGKGRKRRKK